MAALGRRLEHGKGVELVMRLVLLVAMGLALAPRTARADGPAPSAADKETSRALYIKGMAAVDARDFVTAERDCGAVVKLVNVPTGAVCWAKALEAMGKLVEGRDAYLSAARYPSKPDEPAVFASARAEGQAGADRLEARIATLMLDVSGVAPSAPLRVTIDDVEVASGASRLPRRVNPGRHVVLVSSTGYRTARVETVEQEGQEAHVSVALSPNGTGAEGASRSAFSAPTPSKVPAFIAFGGGGVGLVIGSIFGAMALSDASGLKSKNGCPSSCPQSAQSQIDSLHATQWVSDIGLGLGVLGVGIGTALFFTAHAPEAPPTTSLRVDVGPGIVDVRGGF